MFRFLHLADLHLDTVFASRRQTTREHLRKAVRRALELSIDFAISSDLDAVVIAGDLFDNDQLAYSTEKFIIAQMERLNDAGISVIYCTGNHDPGGPLNRASRIQWPSNCHLIDSQKPVSINVRSKSGVEVAIVGAGHDSPDIRDNLAGQFPVACGSIPHIGVLHAHVLESATGSSHKKYAPCSSSDLESKGYAYWALGHIHVRQQPGKTSNAWYSGNIQGRTPRESGSKGGLVVSIDRTGLSDVRFYEFGPVVWKDVDVSLTPEFSHIDQVARFLEYEAEKHLSGQRSENMVRFSLSGSTPLTTSLRRPSEIDSLESSLRDVLGVLDVQVDSFKLSTPRDPDKYRSEPNVLGEALSFIESIAENTQDAVSELLGDSSVVEWSEASPEMLDELFSGLREELVDRMVKDA